VPGGSFCVRLRDTLGVVFQDEAFACLFAARGRPAEAPGRLAIVSVLHGTTVGPAGGPLTRCVCGWIGSTCWPGA